MSCALCRNHRKRHVLYVQRCTFHISNAIQSRTRQPTINASTTCILRSKLHIRIISKAIQARTRQPTINACTTCILRSKLHIRFTFLMQSNREPRLLETGGPQWPTCGVECTHLAIRWASDHQTVLPRRPKWAIIRAQRAALDSKSQVASLAGAWPPGANPASGDGWATMAHLWGRMDASGHKMGQRSSDRAAT